MANHECSTKATSSAMCHQGLVPCHNRFSWLHPNLEKDPAVQFACKTADISHGTRVIASILRQHLVDLSAIAAGAGASIKPLLNEDDTQALAALLEVSLDTLCDMADSNLELIDSQALKGSRA